MGSKKTLAEYQIAFKRDSYTNRSFRTTDTSSDLSLAFVSLKLALNAFFGSYLNLHRNFRYDPDKIDSSHKYFEIYTETIIHFQHFFELIIKDLLRKENDVFAASFSKEESFKSLVIALRGQSLTTEEKDALHSIEFKEALDRLSFLPLPATKKKSNLHKILINNHLILSYLSELRNRTWHRGAYFLKYDAFNEFIGVHILPLILEIRKTKYYRNMPQYLPKEIKTQTDIVYEIVRQYKKPRSIKSWRINLLKEMGRASFESPASSYLKILKKEKRQKQSENPFSRRFKLSTMIRHQLQYAVEDGEMKANNIANVRSAAIDKCPICDQKTLVLMIEYHEIEHESHEFVEQAVCQTCTFNIYNDIDLSANPYSIKNFFS